MSGSSAIIGALVSGRERQDKARLRSGNMLRTRPNLAGCGDVGIRPGAKGCGPTPEAGKGQEMDFLLELPKGTQPHQHVGFGPVKPISDSDLQSCTVRSKMYCLSH